MNSIDEMVADIPRIRTCNRHVDCDIAEQVWKDHALEVARKYAADFPNSGPVRPKTLPAGFHCHDECCEDCFGS